MEGNEILFFLGYSAIKIKRYSKLNLIKVS